MNGVETKMNVLYECLDLAVGDVRVWVNDSVCVF